MSKISCFISGNYLAAFIRLLILCWLYGGISSCKREHTEPLDYEAFSSVVSREGKTLTYFADPRNIPDVPIRLYPTITFEAQTFNEPSVIRLDVQKMSFSSLPDALTPLFVNTCKWGVLSSTPQLNKPFRIEIPYELPDTSLWLESYQQQFRLYKIPIGAETSRPQNWTLVTGATHDTNKRTISASIADFNHAYCILFGEIYRNDNMAITSSGLVNTTQSGAVASYFSGTNSATRGLYYRNNTSAYYYEGIWNDDFSIGFSFTGNSTGTYRGNTIRVKYRYKKNSNGWQHEFNATETTTITITEYNEIGGLVSGNISGELMNEKAEKIKFIMNFKLTRTR